MRKTSGDPSPSFADAFRTEPSSRWRRFAARSAARTRRRYRGAGSWARTRHRRVRGHESAGRPGTRTTAPIQVPRRSCLRGAVRVLRARDRAGWRSRGLSGRTLDLLAHARCASPRTASGLALFCGYVVLKLAIAASSWPSETHSGTCALMDGCPARGRSFLSGRYLAADEGERDALHAPKEVSGARGFPVSPDRFGSVRAPSGAASAGRAAATPIARPGRHPAARATRPRRAPRSPASRPARTPG